MTEAEITFAAQVLSFLEAAGLTFGDIVVLLVMAGFFWLVHVGRLKIGGNGYVTEREFRDAHKAVHARLERHLAIIEEAREDIKELTAKVAHLDGQLEQYRQK